MSGESGAVDHAPSTGTRLARGLMCAASVAAVVAAGTSLLQVPEAPPETVMVEVWRSWGLVVFAGVFGLLAWRPLTYAGVWELVILHKVALTVSAGVYAVGDGARDAGSTLVWDGALSAVLVVAYVSCRGWRAWAHQQSYRPTGATGRVRKAP